MQATLLDIDFEAELRAIQQRRIKDRSKGRHLSEIIHYYIDHVQPGRFGGGPIDPALVHGGFLWEDTISVVLASHLGIGNQVEVEDDGIFMTPDGFNSQRWRVIECKDTKISAANPIRSRKFEHWHLQIMCYCRYWRTREAELYVRHVNGAYELGGGRFGRTVVKPWLMTYSQREIEETWSLILRLRDEMEEVA